MPEPAPKNEFNELVVFPVPAEVTKKAFLCPDVVLYSSKPPKNELEDGTGIAGYQDEIVSADRIVGRLDKIF